MRCGLGQPPLGVTLNTTEPPFQANGTCSDEKTLRQLSAVAFQVVEFARCRAAGLAAA
jgi:hypothetical protein